MAKLMDRYRHSGFEFEEQILEELTVVLSEALGDDARVRTMPGLPFASNADSVPDGLIEISTPSKTLMIYVEVKKNVYPRDIRDAAWQLNNYIRSHWNGSSRLSQPGCQAGASIPKYSLF
ncbi:hypothetical protein D3C85_1312350 [compost metagenome]